MDLSINNLAYQCGIAPELLAPLASAADFDNEFEYLPVVRLGTAEDYTYLNAASCPDCAAGMIRQGRCCVCPTCGFESCQV
jgi:hypothetical protein